MELPTANCHRGGTGTAQCSAALGDAGGLVCRSSQSLLVEPS